MNNNTDILTRIQEQQDLDIITKNFETHYKICLSEERLLDLSVLKVSLDQHQYIKMKCFIEYAKDCNKHCIFDNSVSEVVNQINSSIFESHKEILNNDIEYLGLYPINKEEVIYCAVTGNPLQHKEIVFYKEGYGYIASEKVDQRDIDEGNVFYTSIGYEEVERKALRPIQYIEEKKIEDGEI